MTTRPVSSSWESRDKAAEQYYGGLVPLLVTAHLWDRVVHHHDDLPHGDPIYLRRNLMLKILDQSRLNKETLLKDTSPFGCRLAAAQRDELTLQRIGHIPMPWIPMQEIGFADIETSTVGPALRKELARRPKHTSEQETKVVVRSDSVPNFSVFSLKKPILIWLIDMLTIASLVSLSLLLTNHTAAIAAALSYIAVREGVNAFVKSEFRKERD